MALVIGNQTYGIKYSFDRGFSRLLDCCWKILKLWDTFRLDPAPVFMLPEGPSTAIGQWLVKFDDNIDELRAALRTARIR